MSDEMDLSEYLERGGRLTSPGNVPPRYRAELMKIMATFADSELAGAAGFADVINAAPGIEARIAAARIVAEKTASAGRVLMLMGEFGANTDRYATHHPWTDRLPRDTPPGTPRSAHDLRLSVLNYPLAGWADAVAMNLCTGLAVCVQIEDMARASYQPFAEVMRAVLPTERRHAELAEAGAARLLAGEDGAAFRESLDYWTPRVDAMFGEVAPDRLARLRAWGLRHRDGAELRADWRDRLTQALERLES